MENPPPNFSSPPPAPPVISPMRPTPPPRKGRGWMILAFVLLVLLGLSMLMNLGSFSRHFTGHDTYARNTGPKIEEVVREDNNASDKIAIINVDGIITSEVREGGYTMVDVIRAQLNEASDDKNVKAVILKVDSPGGEVLASDEIYNAVVNFQEESGKPVIASMGNLAASGGYYIAVGARWIVANELTLTGSIGVIMQSINFRGLMDKVGVQPVTFKSGRFKDMLSPMRQPSEIPPEENKMVQDLIDETFEKFKGIVAEGRTRANDANQGSKEHGQSLTDEWENFADGRVLSGTEAYRLGFVDELGNFDSAVARALTLAKIRNANLIEYQQHLDFSDLFRLFGKSESRAIKVDIGIDAPKLKAGYLYFLSPTLIH